ncbi:CCAAT/enhancer-binding protein zeta-like [Atheta coriaria]|uniref:CCAAT/enhancer-binding protein zeta-like n=1 Tax=Dalotia coriaria TaxID=877792 RepID=UPI0031F4595F
MKSNQREFANDGDYNEFYEKPKWFEQISEDPKKFEKVSDQVLIELKEEAKKILDSEIANYNIKNSKINTDYRWMKTVMSKGTVSDKIAAYTILIQDSPVFNLETIRNAIGMVKVGKKKECVAVIETLSELFLSDLLRPNEKLRSFYDRPLSQLSELSSGNAITRRKYLYHWYFEDQLKEAYNTFVQALNAASHDTVDSNKEKAVAAMSNLLSGNPEQEKNLLSHVVNKLGDPSQKVASKAMYCLTQVLKKHANMQGVVLREIEKLLFRANIGHKAQYYSLCFISQFYLCAENPEVARKLIEVYFSFFKKCIKEGDVDSRMMSVLLIGVNRAYPYAKLELGTISEHIDTMYRVVHVANFNVALNALSLLFQVSQCADSVNDRFYSALYRKLLDSKLPSCTNQAVLLNLVYKAMTRDEKTERILAFIKRLLQIAMNVQPNFACGIIFLISQMLSKKTGLNLLQIKSVEGNVKVKEENEDDDDEEERYTDVKDNDDEGNKEGGNKVEEATVGWMHRVQNPITNVEVKVERKPKDFYDPLARNPLYANTNFSAYFELLELKNHYHPSVRLFAENILDGKKIIYTGDPLKDFTLIRFLERFVFKNPKKIDEDTSTTSTFSKRKHYQPQGIRSMAVFSNDYITQNEKNIPVDELFLYTYMQERYKETKIKENGDDDSDLESVASEEFEDMLSKMSGFKDDDEDDIDYMNEVGENMKNKKEKTTKKKSDGDDDDEEGSDDDDDDDDDNDLSDEGSHISDDDEDDLDMNDEDRELLGDLSDGDDDEELFLDEDDEDDIMLDTKSSKSKKSAKAKKKTNTGSIFASADEFASLLEDEGNSKVAPGSSQQFANTDKAGAKQLDWEDKRNRWISGYNSAMGKNKGKKRPNYSSTHKNKKQKKSR